MSYFVEKHQKACYAIKNRESDIITFWGDDVEQPIITAGKIIYNDIKQRGYWDLWNAWFDRDDVIEENVFKID